MFCNAISGLDQAGGKNQGTGLQDELAVQEAPFVTLAEAGAQAKTKLFAWVPAFAGMTVGAVLRLLHEPWGACVVWSR
jgi:hypothetical protein